jgi:hypothetical protein
MICELVFLRTMLVVHRTLENASRGGSSLSIASLLCEQESIARWL